jgi:trk system potassium uptake protein TrkA
MQDVDMLIAVTDNDELNMVACQVAYTLFNVPKKIARVDSQYFLNPLWNTLYNEKNLPIDLVITPDVEIARFIAELFEYPGSTAIFPLVGKKINIFAFRHKDADIPFMKFSLRHINNKLAELLAKIVLIVRGNRRIIPDDETFLQRNDMIYVSCMPQQNIEVMRLFGVDHNPYERITIFGANAISYYLASQIEKKENVSYCSIIEQDAKKAAAIAEKLDTTSVVTGELMSDVILQEVGFSSADVSVAVTDKDKDNLLISLLAAKNKDTQAISLVNSRDYNTLTGNLRNNIIIDRSMITISAILSSLRKARIDESYSLGRNMGEIWEIRLGDDSVNVGRKVADLKISEDSAVMLIVRGDELIYACADVPLQAEDKLIVYVAPQNIRQIEKIFYR